MTYLLNNPGIVLGLLWQHIQITLVALAIAAVIALPLGWLLDRQRRGGHQYRY